MNLGFRTILLCVAVAFFVLGVFAEERYADFLTLGLAAFAGAFLSDALGFADRSFSNTRSKDSN